MKLRRQKKKHTRGSLQQLRERAVKFQQTGDLPNAAQCYRKIISITPNEANMHNDLGSIYYRLGKYLEAATCYQKAIDLNPKHSQAQYNLGNAYTILKQPEAALVNYQNAINLDQSNLDAINNMANILYDQGEISKASKLFDKALTLAPDHPQMRSILISSQNYLTNINPARHLQLATEWWQHHGRPIYRKTIYRNSTDTQRRLKIGFLSPDFREHSIAYFFLPLMSSINREQLEITCYSDTDRPDSTTRKIALYADHWRDTAQDTDNQLARIIEQDKIDILIDLAGHMTGNRLMVFARKPAPIQISWLGYPNTTGLPTIKYRLTDEICDPEGVTDKFYSEKLLRLPNGFLCYSPPEETPSPESKGDKKTFTFASFNNPAKMNEQTIEVWSEILRKLPSANLLLKGRLFNNSPTREIFSKKFQRYGANIEQISYLPFTKTTKEHLLLYNKVDICLDPFPYNGTTTTCEALWMGVPVVTLLGRQHGARVSASIIHRIGLTELICNSKEEYISKAIEISQDPDKLHNWHLNIRQLMKSSPLCDTNGFAKEIETVFRRIWTNEQSTS